MVLIAIGSIYSSVSLVIKSIEKECERYERHKTTKIVSIGGCSSDGHCGVLLEDGSEHISKLPIVSGTIKSKNCN